MELCRNKTVYKQTHNFPDPDTIASAFGLQKLLQHYGVESKQCYEGRIDKINTAALEDVGSGGGHAGMAGGLIPKKNLPLLGDYPGQRITQLFLNALEKITT